MVLLVLSQNMNGVMDLQIKLLNDMISTIYLYEYVLNTNTAFNTTGESAVDLLTLCENGFADLDAYCAH
jgi:hypothetical protein